MTRTCVPCPEGYWDPTQEPGLGKGSVREFPASGQDASWTSPWGGGVTPGQTMDTLEGLYLAAGLRTSGRPSGGVGGSDWEEKHLDILAQAVAPVTQTWIRSRQRNKAKRFRGFWCGTYVRAKRQLRIPYLCLDLLILPLHSLESSDWVFYCHRWCFLGILCALDI